MEDWATMREVMEAVRQAIPDASSKQPGQVLAFVLNALRMADITQSTVRKTTEKPTVLVAQAKSVNDTIGRFYNCMAKSLAFQFCTF